MSELQTWRCQRCGRILAQHDIPAGTLVIKCKCNEYNSLVMVPAPADCTPVPERVIVSVAS